MALPDFALVLADSTAYGWLEGSSRGGTKLVHREAAAGAEQRSALVAAVVCGGSLIKKGSAGPCAVDVLMKDWTLQGGAAAFAGEQEVEVGVVPAASSVPGREYEGLQTARAGFGVEETHTTILAAVGNAYGAKAKPLHFLRAEAARAMDAVVRATIQDLVARRAARQQLAITAEQRAAGAEQRSAQWLPVIICAGWNCGEKEVLAEAYVAAKLSKCLQWREFLQGLSAHATFRLPWQEIASHLSLAPARLVQTNNEDHTSAKENMDEFAAFLARGFVDDAVCRNDIRQLGGAVLLQKYLGIVRPSHRADMWRYIHLFQHGGYYLDIKMCLLRPLEQTLAEIYRQGNASGGADEAAQRAAVWARGGSGCDRGRAAQRAAGAVGRAAGEAAAFDHEPWSQPAARLPGQHLGVQCGASALGASHLRLLADNANAAGRQISSVLRVSLAGDGDGLGSGAANWLEFLPHPRTHLFAGGALGQGSGQEGAACEDVQRAGCPHGRALHVLGAV